MPGDYISVENVTVELGEKRIIDSLSLELKGRSVCLFGKSGCGKTTLLQAMSGLVPMKEGCFFGLPERIAYLFQEDRLLPWVNALENVKVAARVDESAATRWLLDMGLEHADIAKLPGQLSGGMRRRVAFARALAYDGELLLLDEPFRGLDGERREALMELVEKHTASKRMVMVTHDIYEAERLCDQIIYLDGPPLKQIIRE